MVRGSGYFEEIEIWGKREVYKDPIAVGITGNGERHLICRWGKDKLIPFESIKSRSWLYHLQNFGVMVVTSEKFWLSYCGSHASWHRLHGNLVNATEIVSRHGGDHFIDSTAVLSSDRGPIQLRGSWYSIRTSITASILYELVILGGVLNSTDKLA
jgi:hypothetical protein